MPSCPFCQTEIPDDFGLIDCPNCQAALFVDMDGSVQASAPAVRETNRSLEPEAPDEEFGATFAAQLVEESLEQEEAAHFEETDELKESPVEFSSFEEMAGEEPPSPPPEEAMQSAEAMQNFDGGGEALEDFSMDELQNESFEASPRGADAPLEVPPQVRPADSGMDISNMATAMDQEGVTEGLRYDLEITGIDTADLRREVMESLMDKKLGWNVEELMARISAGSLTLKGLTAVKAHVVVQRLKTLPLEMRWDQHADT